MDIAKQTELSKACVELQSPPAPAHAQEASLLAVIARAAENPNVDVEKMERLLVMHERIHERQAVASFNEAMSNVQRDTPAIETDKLNKHTKSKYASYPQIDRAIRPLYTANGLALMFGEAESGEGFVVVTCKVAHAQGHHELFTKRMPITTRGLQGGAMMTDTHASGSADTYGMRYLVKKIFNLAVVIGEHDDDGNQSPNKRRYITPDQLDVLAAALGTGERIKKACEWAGCDNLTEFPSSLFDKAVASAERQKQESV